MKIIAATLVAASAALVGAAPVAAASGPTFFGSCRLTGTTAFHLPLSYAGNFGVSDTTAAGVCSGSFVDAAGEHHTLAAEPAQYLGFDDLGRSNCLSGSGLGGLNLTIDGVQFGLSTTSHRVYNVDTLNGIGPDNGHAVVNQVLNAGTLLKNCSTGVAVIGVSVTLRAVTTLHA